MNNNLDISILKKGLPAITPAIGSTLVEACSICLESNNHKASVVLFSEGTFNEKFKLKFSKTNEQIQLSWKDLQFATEQGAICIALVLIVNKTNYTVVERAVKTTGIDYWLAEKDNKKESLPFEKSARLEVSGILNGQNKDIQTRLNSKIIQTKQSDETKLSKFIAVVEFSKPLIKLIKL